MKFTKFARITKLGSLAILAVSFGGCGMFTAHYTGTESIPGMTGGGASGSYQVTMTLVDQTNGHVRGTYGSNSPLFQAGSVDATASGDTLSNFTIDMYASASGGSGCRFQGNLTSSGASRDTLQGSLVGSGANCNGQIKNLNLTRVK